MNKASSSNSVNAKSNAMIMLVILLIFGLVLGGVGVYRYKLGQKSADWPSVKGKITYSHAQPRKAKTGHEYMPTVKYNYIVNGTSYTGTRITSSDEYQKTLTGAEDILRDYPVGKDVSVYYDSSNPRVSLLETGIKRNVYVLLLGAAACFFFSFSIVTSMLKKRNSKR